MQLSLALMAIGPVLSASSAASAEPLKHFITARGDQLFEGGDRFRFISFNIPNLLLIEDSVAFSETHPWRLPDKFEITDALAAMKQMGGTVARTYVISVLRTNDPPGEPKHVLGPGKFNEEAFRALDLVLQTANEQGVRLIIPLVDNWIWMGGRAEYAGWRGRTKDDFWTDPQLIADFKETIRFVLTRTNTLTGVRYLDDKSILCWETGNELYSPPEWTREIAAYLKRLDTNHLVMDGFHTPELRPESLAIPEVDIVTTHHYPNMRAQKTFADLIRANAAMARGRKPYVVGEFGFVNTAQMEEAMRATLDTGIPGGLLWSLRFRNRDGGFYWHSEPSGGNQYKAFHWPPSPIGDAYDEIRLMNAVRQFAFQIRGLTPPPIPVPAPPKLLPAVNVALSWQGSVGAVHYTVERAPSARGPWTVAGERIDESFVQYRPQFVDETAPIGDWFYRVRAVNHAGASDPSNIAGPVKVTKGTFVDELADFSRAKARLGGLEIRTRDCRKAKEDAHRAAGNAGDALVYQLPSAVEGFRVFTFFPANVADLKFAVSTDGNSWREIAFGKESYFHGVGDYGYWKPVLFHADAITAKGRFLRIELTGETQIGRVEIFHALEKQ